MIENVDRRMDGWTSDAGVIALLIAHLKVFCWCIRSSTAPQGNSFDYTTNRHEMTL